MRRERDEERMAQHHCGHRGDGLGTRLCPTSHRDERTHSLHRLMMPVFFLAFSVLLADSDSGSISHDSP